MKKVIEEYTPQKLGPHTTYEIRYGITLESSFEKLAPHTIWVRNGTAESVFVDVTNSRTLT